MSECISDWKYAFSLPPTEVRKQKPPGTVRLIERRSFAGAVDGHVIKYPVPSADPADPLNWALWRKIACLSVVSLYACVANFTGTSIIPVLPMWNQVFRDEPKQLPELNQLVAIQVLMMGFANVFWVPLANVFGRRTILILSTLILFVSTLCGGRTSSFESLLVIRAFQGIGGAASETIAPGLIGEIFFVHQRGRAMGAFTASLASGAIVGGVSGGYIGHQLGWAYLFWVGTGLTAAVFLGILVLVPETLYHRVRQLKPQKTRLDVAISKNGLPVVVEAPGIPRYKPYTFLRSLAVGRYEGGILHQFVRPWVTLRLPGTWVVMLQYGGIVGGVVVMTTVGPQLLIAPPYLWEQNAGLIFIGSLIGILVAAFIIHIFADRIVERYAKRQNQGYAEPEARLYMMLQALLAATIGLIVFGICADYSGPNRWIGLGFGFGMAAYGNAQVPSIGFGYLIDAYSHLAGDCFVMVCVLRAIISFAWTFFVGEWTRSAGYALPFGIFALILGVFALLTIPLILWGKRFRIATARVVIREDQKRGETTNLVPPVGEGLGFGFQATRRSRRKKW